jgi:DNA-binding NarL/FixJ family response regulator
LKVVLVGAPEPFREAVADRLEEREHELLGTASPDDGDVVVIYCNSEPAWGLLNEALVAGPTLAILTNLCLDDYRRALVAGAGTIYHDMPASAVVAAIEATARWETLLPVGIAQQLAGRVHIDHADFDLTIPETELLGALADGVTVAELADRLGYSDRTLRRRMQSLFVTLGVENRHQAVRVATASALI